MSEQEFWLLHEHFGTERFNLHPEREFPLQHPLSVSIRERIYIENADQCHSLLESDVEGYAGICLDLSHYESMRKLHPKAAANLAKMLTKFPIGANHISAVYKDSSAPRDEDCLSIHHLSELTTLDYVRGFSPLLFGEFMAIELENSITDQVQALKELTEIMISNSDIVDESQIERVAEGARSVLF